MPRGQADGEVFMAHQDSTEPVDARAALTAALARLRSRVPDVSDETLARRAGAVPLPSGRRVTVNPRRLGEWLSGRSVPRAFDQLLAVVQAINGGPAGLSAQQWRLLWQAAQTQRAESRTVRPAGGAPALVVGRPPSDAAALCGREPIAAAIDAALRDDAIRQVVLTGPGGAGKSQLAAAAFHRARSRGGVFAWVPASSRQSVLTAYARTWRVIASGAQEGRPLDAYGHDEQAQADLLVAWMRSAGQPWLVILDDVDDPMELDGLWPIGEQGRSIVTTRRRDAALIRPSARVITVGMFEPQESQAYLRSRLPADQAVGAGAAAADGELAALAAALGHFPLALSQAAAYLIDTAMSVAAYRRLVDDRRERIDDLFPSSSPADGHDRTVASTWQVSAARAGALARPGTAQRLLELMAMLAPEGVPEAVLTTPAACAQIGGTQRDALHALRALHRLSLVTHDASTVAMHALVQRAVLDHVPEEALPGMAVAAADALDQVWARAPGGPGWQAALYDSVEALCRAAGDHLWDGGMHPVLRRVGKHLVDLGRADAARDVAERLLRQARTRLGDGHRDVLFLDSQVACAQGELGDWAAAYADLTRLRRDAERLLGPQDPDTLEARLRQGRARFEAGAAGAAREDLLALVADATTTLGRRHPLTRAAAAEVVLCTGLTGDPAAARDLSTVLVAELTEQLGARHPETLAVAAGLGRWIGEAGDPELAVRTHIDVVAGLDAVAGRLHHDTLAARHNLAYWRALAGRLPLAVAEFGVAAEDAEQALGPRHPTTLTFRANLAYWRGLAGDATRGAAELAELQPVLHEVLGAAHPRTLRVRQQRAELLHRGGDPVAATAELATTLARMRAVHGDDHARTRDVAELLAAWAAVESSVPRGAVRREPGAGA
jgi:hypothetical protein